MIPIDNHINDVVSLKYDMVKNRRISIVKRVKKKKLQRKILRAVKLSSNRHVKQQIKRARNSKTVHARSKKNVHSKASIRKQSFKSTKVTFAGKIARLQLPALSIRRKINGISSLSAHVWHNHWRILFPAVTLMLISGVAFYWFILKDLPSPAMLTTSPIPLTTTIRARDGRVLYRIYKSANRFNLSWNEIPDVVKKATIAIEDADFYSHPGISPKAMVRALIYNLHQQDIGNFQGGSTITQQLVKNRLLGPKRTYTRKMKESILAILTELKFSKKDILTFYLNEVGYGGPSRGIEAASQMYFGIPAKNLDLTQAAFLAGLTAAPTTFSPFGVNPQLATIRQREVLSRMHALGMISKKDYENAINEKLVFAPQKTDILAPHFVMFVKQELVKKFGEQMVEEGGLDVVTTLDLDIQEKAQEIVRKNVEEIKDRYNIHNAASLITNPTTGEILAMVGSVDYYDTGNYGHVNVTTMPRQPGSSIKPVNYAYAFSHGWSPTSTIEDSPVVYVAPGSTETYAPQNYDQKFHGRVTLRDALARSYNVPAVKVLNSYGVKNMLELGKEMGIKSWDNSPPIGLSLTLGGLEVTMLDMARVYGTIANLGVRKDLRIIKELHDGNRADITAKFYQNDISNSIIGSVVAEDNKQVIPALSAYWLTDILSDNNARLPAFGPYAKLTVPDHKVAVKTGTSNNFRDNWTIGFTPDYLVATWVGNSDGSFMNKNLVSGITGAAPIWNDTMTALLQNVPDKEFPKPEGLIPVKICAVNGLLTCPYCPSEKIEYFSPEKVPTQQCSFRSPTDCDDAKKSAEGKSDDERKQILAGCMGS